MSSQRVAGSPTARHCTTQSIHDEALLSPHFYERDQRKVKHRIARHMRYSRLWMPYLSKLITVLATGPWSFLYTSLFDEVKHIAKRLGLEDRVTPHQTRHSGPSIDRAGKFRSLEKVRQRGAWTSMSSVLRYDKSSKFAADYHAILARARVRIEHTASHH